MWCTDTVGRERACVYARGVPHDELVVLRRYDPVHWHPFPGTRGGFWLLSKHADVIAAAKDPRLFSSQVGHIALEDREPDALAARQSLIETDPPEHTRLRKLVSYAFTRTLQAYGFFQLPIYQDVNGVQLVAKYAFAAGLNVRF